MQPHVAYPGCIYPNKFASNLLTNVFNHMFGYLPPLGVCFYMKNITFEDHSFFQSIFRREKPEVHLTVRLWEPPNEWRTLGVDISVELKTIDSFLQT